MAHYPRLIVAGTHSGVGKTTVTLAILAALRKRGRLVQPFKAGPDFIDPGHHSMVTGRASRNLDGWMVDAATNREIFTRAAADLELPTHDAQGVMIGVDGLLAHNTLALYTHLHFASQPQVARALVAAAAGSRASSGVQR